MAKQTMPADRQVIVSGVRPTGDLHIGNYLGAIKQFIELQKKYRTFFFIADLHGITEPREPKELSQQTIAVASLYLACGLDPKKTTIFVQSHVQEHAELSLIFGALTPTGELSRMTQYKEKIAEGKPANLGLFAYPVLMAADILIYKAERVPVGEDQFQHLEFARTIARKFNQRFGKTFPEPQAISAPKGAERLKSLVDPTKKMSKSHNKDSAVFITDSPAEIKSKIKKAVTDSGKEIKFDTKNKPAISNLLTIYSLMSDTPIAKLEIKYKNKTYSEFKSDLAELLVKKLSPIQKKYKELAQKPESVLKILRDGAKEARKVSEATMKEVRDKIGLLQEDEH